MAVELLDAAGRRRSPATLPGYRRGCVPRNKGRRYPADPPRIEEIIAVMRAAGPGDHGDRVRGLVLILWRAGLRIDEALSLAETDLEPRRADRCSCGAARAESVVRLVWMTGRGNTSSHGSTFASACRSARSSVSLKAPPVAVRGHKLVLAPNCDASPCKRVCADALPPTSSAMLMLWRWPVKGSHCRSSNASSGMHTSA